MLQVFCCHYLCCDDLHLKKLKHTLHTITSILYTCCWNAFFIFLFTWVWQKCLCWRNNTYTNIQRQETTAMYVYSWCNFTFNLVIAYFSLIHKEFYQDIGYLTLVNWLLKLDFNLDLRLLCIMAILCSLCHKSISFNKKKVTYYSSILWNTVAIVLLTIQSLRYCNSDTKFSVIMAVMNRYDIWVDSTNYI